MPIRSCWAADRASGDAALVAVYGTLKRGLGNHAFLAQAHYIGRDMLSQISLYDIGPYPGARLESSLGIEVEVYAISDKELAQLDLLEEHDPTDPDNSLYTRELLETCFGLAWVYLYQGELSNMPCIRSGAWHPQAHCPASKVSEDQA